MIVLSNNSISLKYDFENSERGFINSSGYYIEELKTPNSCKLGFWIECEISNDESLQDHVLRDYLNHIKKIKENILFDISK